eukprot:Tbor_TRINITY_DN5746_c0_g1::TRINITY_DN5746_c0_g1_i1::g.20051::m.20051
MSNRVLAEKGIFMIMQSPLRLVAFRRVYLHPVTGVRVILHPNPNIAMKSFFDEMIFNLEKRSDLDKVLVEDGTLPYTLDHPNANRTQIIQKLIPWFAFRNVTNQTAKYDGVVERDPIESRIAYLSATRGNEPVDPRARRAMDRVMSYPNNTSVVLPWTLYHMPYFFQSLERHGFELQRNEEVVVLDQFNMFMFTVMPMIMMFWTMYFLFKLILWI